MKEPKPKAAIDAKRQLWESIQKVAAGELAHLDVILELNPYCREINAEPLEVRLDYCNVSFRSVDGYYVDHTECGCSSAEYYHSQFADSLVDQLLNKDEQYINPLEAYVHCMFS